jgi:hypothetical protein
MDTATRHYKVLICGDRNWSFHEPIHSFIDLLNTNTTVIEGGARGADTIAGDYARSKKMKVTTVHANWNEYKRAAGPIRNREMLQENPDLVVGFHDDIFSSKGTKDMISITRTRGFPYMVINSEGVIYQYGNLKQEWIDKLGKTNFRFKGGNGVNKFFDTVGD